MNNLHGNRSEIFLRIYAIDSVMSRKETKLNLRLATDLSDDGTISFTTSGPSSALLSSLSYKTGTTPRCRQALLRRLFESLLSACISGEKLPLKYTALTFRKLEFMTSCIGLESISSSASCSGSNRTFLRRKAMLLEKIGRKYRPLLCARQCVEAVNRRINHVICNYILQYSMASKRPYSHSAPHHFP